MIFGAQGIGFKLSKGRDTPEPSNVTEGLELISGFLMSNLVPLKVFLIIVVLVPSLCDLLVVNPDVGELAKGKPIDDQHTGHLEARKDNSRNRVAPVAVV